MLGKSQRHQSPGWTGLPKPCLFKANPRDFRIPQPVTAVTLHVRENWVPSFNVWAIRGLMDRRRESRVDTALPVRIWGVDTYCRPFMQLASVRNISNLGAVLQNVRSQIKPGEILDVQYDGQKAQFRVVWTGKAGTMEAGEVGLQRLPDEPYIWDVDPLRCTQTLAEG